MPDVKARRRRWAPRFGLRTLLVLFTLVGVAGGAFGVFLQRARTQRAAVAELRAAEASVSYEWKFMERHGPNVVGWSPYTWQEKWDDWLARTFGVDAVYGVDGVHFFQFSRVNEQTMRAAQRLPRLRELHVVVEDVWGKKAISPEAWRELCRCSKVEHLWLKRGRHAGYKLSGIAQLNQLTELTIDGGKLTREDCEEIGKLRQLNNLKLGAVRATSDHVAPLSALSRLETLELTLFGVDNKQVTDASVELIAEMQGLRSLALARIPLLTDDVFKGIAKLRRLESLNLDQAGIRGTGLGRLQACPALHTLNLIGTQVDDDAMRAIGGFSGLRSVDISYTAVTDAGLKHLEGLAKVRSLWLGALNITDEGMLSIAKLKNLEELGLRETKLTDRGAERLLALPNLRRLYLDETRVSPAMKAKLSKALGITVR